MSSERRERLRAVASHIDDIPLEFVCPITADIMLFPVVAMDGHTYEKRAIEDWYKQNRTSPVTREAINPSLIPNHSMRSQIASWLDRQKIV